MSIGLYLRNFCGFALQLAPCAMLLLVPFRDGDYAGGKRRAYAWLAALSLGFSLCYPLSVWWNMGQAVSIFPAVQAQRSVSRSDEAIIPNDLYGAIDNHIEAELIDGERITLHCLIDGFVLLNYIRKLILFSLFR